MSSTKRSWARALTVIALLLLPLTITGVPPAAADSVGGLPGQFPFNLERTAVASHGKLLFTFGAEPYQTTHQRHEIFRYDPEQGSATQVASLPFGRSRASAVTVDDAIFVFGGHCRYSCSLYATSQVVRFDPLTYSTSVVASLPSGRYDMAATAHGGYIYVFGGESLHTGRVAEILRFDPNTNQIQIMPTRLPIATSQVAAASDGDAIYLFGGRSSKGWHDTILRYTPDNGMLETLTEKVSPPDAGMAAVWDDANFFLLGGASDTRRIAKFHPTRGYGPMSSRLPANYRAPSAATIGEDILFVGLGKSVMRYQTMPGAPTAVDADGGLFLVNLTWSLPPENSYSKAITDHVIERSRSGTGPFVPIGSTASPALHFTDAGLEGATTYFYRVRAINPAGHGTHSEPVSATTFAPPSMPLQVVAQTDVDQPEPEKSRPDRIQVTWMPPASDGGAPVHTYYVDRATRGVYAPIARVESDWCSHSTTPVTCEVFDDGCPVRTDCKYRVRAENAVGTGPPNFSPTTQHHGLRPVLRESTPDPQHGNRDLDQDLLHLPLDLRDHDQPIRGQTRTRAYQPVATIHYVSNVDGRHGEAYAFDAATESRIESTIPGNVLVQAFTLQAWVQPAMTSPGVVLSLEEASRSLQVGVDGVGKALVAVEQDGERMETTSAAQLTVGEWHHIAVRWNETSLELLVDAESSGVIQIPVMSVANARVSVGGSEKTGHSNFTGFVDDVRLTGRAVSNLELREIMTEPYVAVGWHGNDFDGDTIPDEQEAGFGTSLAYPDSDLDLITDYQEIHVYGTEAQNPDTDGDGLTDGHEVYHLGSDPHSPDTDSDGLTDGSDPAPTRDSVAPTYDVPGETFLAISEDGYIDVLVTTAASDEAEIQAVILSGNLSAENKSGPVPYPLYFRLEAQRGDGGLWSARFPIPPGVTAITKEQLQVLVVDSAGNAYSSLQSFDHRIGGNEWTTKYETLQQASGWKSILEHTSTGTIVAPGVESTTSTIWLYQLDEGNMTSVGNLDGITIIASESSFARLEFNQSLSAGPLGSYFQRARETVAGYADQWTGYVDAGLAASHTVLKEAYHQTGSVVVGLDSAWADGRVTGDFVSGFFVWGDTRDCLIKPALGHVEDQADAAIAGIACFGLAIELGQATPGAPAAVAGNAALSVAKTAMKAAKRVEPRMVVHIQEMARICVRDASLCGNLLNVAHRVLDDPKSASRLVVSVDAMGVEAFLKVAAKEPGILLRVEDLTSGLATRHGTDTAKIILATLSSSSALGSADNTLEGASRLYKAYADVRVAGPDAASDLLADFSGFVRTEGAAGWLARAEKQALGADSSNGWTGFVTEAGQFRRLADEGRLVKVSEVLTGLRYRGRILNEVEVDGFVKDGDKLRWVEVKSGQLTTSNIPQIERQMFFIREREYAPTLELRVGGSVGDDFVQSAQSLAKEYQVRLEIRDLSGTVVRVVDVT